MAAGPKNAARSGARFPIVPVDLFARAPAARVAVRRPRVAPAFNPASRTTHAARRALFALAWMSVSMSFAAEPDPAENEDEAGARVAELHRFERFLNHHPLIDDDLRSDPSRLRAAPYLERCADLRDFLAAHPRVAAAVEVETHFYLHRAIHQQESARVDKTDEADFDAFCDAHPDVATEVTAQPALLRNADFIARHPDYRDFLLAHPPMRAALSVALDPMSSPPARPPAHRPTTT